MPVPTNLRTNSEGKPHLHKTARETNNSTGTRQSTTPILGIKSKKRGPTQPPRGSSQPPANILPTPPIGSVQVPTEQPAEELNLAVGQTFRV